MPVIVKRVETTSELEGIRNLQAANLRVNIDADTAASQGFLIAKYSLEYLQEMHAASPSIVALDGDRVVGYALVATKEVRDGHDLVADLFNVIDTNTYQGQLLDEVNYVVVGQLCVAEGYRGQGLVKRLYDHYRDCLSASFKYLITDIAQANTRSLKAHKNCGFQVIGTLEFGGIGWDIVLWDWRN